MADSASDRLTRAALLRAVDAARSVRLATVSRKGAPLLTPLWFGRDGDLIYAGTRNGSPHVNNMRHNPRVLMLFATGGSREPGTVVRAAGTARVLGDRMSLRRRAAVVRRYVLAPRSLAHWAANWRKLLMRQRYYAERTDLVMVEITLDGGELLSVPR